MENNNLANLNQEERIVLNLKQNLDIFLNTQGEEKETSKKNIEKLLCEMRILDIYYKYYNLTGTYERNI